MGLLTLFLLKDLILSQMDEREKKLLLVIFFFPTLGPLLRILIIVRQFLVKLRSHIEMGIVKAADMLNPMSVTFVADRTTATPLQAVLLEGWSVPSRLLRPGKRW